MSGGGELLVGNRRLRIQRRVGKASRLRETVDVHHDLGDNDKLGLAILSDRFDCMGEADIPALEALHPHQLGDKGVRHRTRFGKPHNNPSPFLSRGSPFLRQEWRSMGLSAHKASDNCFLLVNLFAAVHLAHEFSRNALRFSRTSNKPANIATHAGAGTPLPFVYRATAKRLSGNGLSAVQHGAGA